MNENKTTSRTENGSVHISDEVVASIAALTAVEVEGVAALSSGVDIGELLGRRNLSRGVKITVKDRTVYLDISMLVRYAFAIPIVAKKVQRKVKDAVESMTGLTVGEINIQVFGVLFDKAAKKKISREKKRNP